MKKPILLLVLASFCAVLIQAQDSLFIFKNNQVVWKNATTEVDSITFKTINKPAKPVFNSFGFEKAKNSVMLQDVHCNINNLNVTADMPLWSRTLIATFTTDAGNTVKVKSLKQINGVTKNDFTSPVVYTITTAKGESAQYTVQINWITGLPEISINTLNSAPILDKENYVRAYVQIDGKGFYPNFADSTGIRGRGNTTWGMPKKPYRLKLDKDGTPFGLLPEKDWILLANYIDPTHLLNSVALTAGQMIGLPFTHHVVPVVLRLNGKYQGVYTFTEHKEVSKSRVNIDKKNGVLFELDTNYDEDFKFRSFGYNLPVMFAAPDLNDFQEPERSQKFETFQNYFTDLEIALKDKTFPNNNYRDLIDVESVAKFLVIYDLTHNMELNHPKSTYLFKDVNKKFVMGPIWDFDWAYGYEGTYRHFASYDVPVLKKITSGSTGTDFFNRFFDDPAFRTLYKNTWATFKYTYLNALLKYIDDNAENIKEDQILDRITWGNGTSNYPNKITELKTWLQNRAVYIETRIDGW